MTQFIFSGLTFFVISFIIVSAARVPLQIIDSQSSSDLVVKEGSNVTLFCKASGDPPPHIWWDRLDGSGFLYNGTNVTRVDGDELTITDVSCHHMSDYRCTASNGVRSYRSKIIKLSVEFTEAEGLVKLEKPEVFAEPDSRFKLDTTIFSFS